MVDKLHILNISHYLNIAFALLTLAAVFHYYRYSGFNKPFGMGLLAWILLQAWVGSTGFYTQTDTVPPRFIWMVVPPIVAICIAMLTGSGRLFMGRLPLKELTLFHTIRIPVELILFNLAKEGAIPFVMTFVGANYDIIMGFSAPVVAYFGFRNPQPHIRLLLIWNILGMVMLTHIVVLAVLSAPTPLQQFAFDQPNIAVSFIPFNWLPSVMVPLVYLAHIAAILQLTKKIKSATVV